MHIQTLLMLLLGLLAALQQASASDCDAKGFTGLASCSDCEMLAEYVKSDALLADCKACCVKDKESTTKYTKATIEICPYRRAGLPQIEEFIRKQKKSFGAALSVREVAGSYPRLVLTGGGAGSERASIRIDNWKAATIGEYLRDRLKLPADDKKPAAA